MNLAARLIVAALVVGLGVAGPAVAGGTTEDDREASENPGLAIDHAVYEYLPKRVRVRVRFSDLASDRDFDHFVYLRAGVRERKLTWVVSRLASGRERMVVLSRAHPDGARVNCRLSWTVDAGAAQKVSLAFPARCLGRGGRGRPPKRLQLSYQIIDDQSSGPLYDSVPGGNSLIGDQGPALSTPIRRGKGASG